MLSFMLNHVGSALVALAVALVAGLAIASLVRRKRAGGCGGGCAGCSNAGVCHRKGARRRS